MVNLLKLYRRNGIIPVYTSISFNYKSNEISIYTDAGRLTRPIYYIENDKNFFLSASQKRKMMLDNNIMKIRQIQKAKFHP